MLPRLMQKQSQEAFLRDAANSEELDQLLTLDELAAELKVPKGKASMLAHWAVGCYKIGNRVLVSRPMLESFLQLLRVP